LVRRSGIDNVGDMLLKKRFQSSTLGVSVHNLASVMLTMGIMLMRSREAVMGGKYSAEWWEQSAGINREISAPHDPFRVIDDLIQATASARPSPARKSEHPGLGSTACRRRSSEERLQIVSWLSLPKS